MILEGKFILVYIKNSSGDWIATACDKTCTLHTESEFLEVTDPNGSNARRRLPTITDWSLSGDGLVDYNREMSALYMQQATLAGTQVSIRFFVQNGDGYAIYEGLGYFLSVDETGAVGSASSYSYSIVADGDLNITSTIPQDSEEGKLFSVLMNDDETLTIDSNDNLILTK